MYFKQFYLQCLAHSSYLIGSEGQAIVVDPQRDVDQYIQEAESNGLKNGEKTGYDRGRHTSTLDQIFL